MIDSSVAVKWFSHEEDTEKALLVRDLHLKGTRRLWVSDLLYHEVANALRYKPGYDEKKLDQAVESLFGLHLGIRPVDNILLARASSIAYKVNVTIYDAVPVALAQLRETLCITADEDSQYKKLKAHGYPVTLLSQERSEFGMARGSKLYTREPEEEHVI